MLASKRSKKISSISNVKSDSNLCAKPNGDSEKLFKICFFENRKLRATRESARTGQEEAERTIGGRD